MACILLLGSVVRIHDSQAYMKTDVTRERIRRILKLREILLSFETGFNLVNAAVACAILESISGLEPSSVISEPRYLKLVTVSSFCPFTSICVDATGVVCQWREYHHIFFDVAGFFVCLVLIEYVVCSVLIEHVQRFEPRIGCSQRDSAL